MGKNVVKQHLLIFILGSAIVGLADQSAEQNYFDLAYQNDFLNLFGRGQVLEVPEILRVVGNSSPMLNRFSASMADLPWSAVGNLIGWGMAFKADPKGPIIGWMEPLDDAAKTYSADPGSKDQGGNLGYVPRGTFVQEFDKVVFTVEKNILTNFDKVILFSKNEIKKIDKSFRKKIFHINISIDKVKQKYVFSKNNKKITNGRTINERPLKYL